MAIIVVRTSAQLHWKPDRTTLCSSTCAKLFSFLTHPPAARGWSDGAVNAKSKREASKLRTLRFEAARLAPLELVSAQIRKAFNKGYEFKQKILPLGQNFNSAKQICVISSTSNKQ